MSTKIDLTVVADDVKVTPSGIYDVEVTVTEVEKQTLLEALEVDDFTNHFELADILGQFDIEDIIDHYGAELVDKIKEDNDLVEAE